LLLRKIRDPCVRSSVSSAAGSYGKRRKVSITISLRRHAMSRAGERESRSESSSGEYQEILPVEAATPRTARSGGVSVMHHRTTVRRADLIGGIVSAAIVRAFARKNNETALVGISRVRATDVEASNRIVTIRKGKPILLRRTKYRVSLSDTRLFAV